MKELTDRKSHPNSGLVEKNFEYVNANYVSIVDIDASIKSMAKFYFKWSIAIIPTGVFWGAIYLFVIRKLIEF